MTDILGRMTALLQMFNKLQPSSSLGLHDLSRWCQRCQVFQQLEGRSEKVKSVPVVSVLCALNKGMFGR